MESLRVVCGGPVRRDSREYLLMSTFRCDLLCLPLQTLFSLDQGRESLPHLFAILEN